MHLKISSGKRRPFCPGWDELIPGQNWPCALVAHQAKYPKYDLRRKRSMIGKLQYNFLYFMLIVTPMPQEISLHKISFISWWPFCEMTLLWRHNGRDGVSNHQPHYCLFDRSCRCKSKKTSNLRVTGLCAWNSRWPMNSKHKWPVTRKMFPFDDVIIYPTTITSLPVCFKPGD